MNIKEFLFEDKELIKRIFKIAIPSLFDLLAQTLIATSDMIMVSSIGASAISSVGVGSAAFNAIIPALIAVAIGTTAILSRAYGARNKEEGQKALIQSYFIAVPIGIFLMFLFFFFAEPIIKIKYTHIITTEPLAIEVARAAPKTSHFKIYIKR